MESKLECKNGVCGPILIFEIKFFHLWIILQLRQNQVFLSCPVLFYPVLFCSFLFCSILFYPALFCSIFPSYIPPYPHHSLTYYVYYPSFYITLFIQPDCILPSSLFPSHFLSHPIVYYFLYIHTKNFYIIN